MSGMSSDRGSRAAGRTGRNGENGEEKRKEEKEKNQTVRLSAVISSIWLGASSWRANSGLAR